MFPPLCAAEHMHPETSRDSLAVHSEPGAQPPSPPPPLAPAGAANGYPQGALGGGRGGGEEEGEERAGAARFARLAYEDSGTAVEGGQMVLQLAGGFLKKYWALPALGGAYGTLGRRWKVGDASVNVLTTTWAAGVWDPGPAVGGGKAILRIPSLRLIHPPSNCSPAYPTTNLRTHPAYPHLLQGGGRTSPLSPWSPWCPWWRTLQQAQQAQWAR